MNKSKACGVHAIRIAVGMSMLALLLVGCAGAATITVNAIGSGDYTRIQEAIDAASAGDTILVYSGIYHENVNVTKQLILRGIGNSVVVAGGDNFFCGSVITLSANGITLEGFTATGSGCNPPVGITVTSSNNMLIGNNASSNNNYGISLRSYSKNNIFNNIFSNTKNVDFKKLTINTWNIPRQSGTNIIGGPYLGGNFWAKPDGTGFSQTCKDVNGDGICDKSFILDANNIDYLPLSMNFMKDKIPPKSVSKLKNVTYEQNYINWTWKDPKDIDFKKVMVFIDGRFKGNV